MTAGRAGTLLTLAATLALAACKDEPPAPAPRPAATVAAPRTLVAANLDTATLGARIAGPQGTEVETRLSAGPRQLATMVSYVACPPGMDPCVPSTAPEGTVYTYVHRITLDEAAPATAGEGAATGPEVIEAQTTLFRTTQPVAGFANSVGYDSAEAEAALEAKDAITVTLDEGRLIWRVVRGPGWRPGAAITLWWQSTAPPQGPQNAYLLEIDGNQARATGPFPAPAPSATPRR